MGIFIIDGAQASSTIVLEIVQVYIYLGHPIQVSEDTFEKEKTI